MARMLDALIRDARYGWRALRKTPAFTLGAIATVALAVGATTAIFSVLDGVLLRELPYRQPARVFWIYSDQPGRDRTPFNVPDFIDYRDGTRTLSGFAGFFSASANLADESAAERVQGIRNTGNLFDVLGAGARLGRVLRPADEQPGADHVVVLSEAFWQRRFGGDPASSADRFVSTARLALGANRSTIAKLIVASGAMSIAIGLATGIALAAGAVQLASSLLFGVAATDIATFVQVAVVVSIVALVAALFPLRALRQPGDAGIAALAGSTGQH